MSSAFDKPVAVQLADAIAPLATKEQQDAATASIIAALGTKAVDLTPVSAAITASQAAITAGQSSLAKTTDITAAKIAIISALSTAGAQSGEVKSFMRSQIPAGWVEAPGLFPVPSGGLVLTISILNGQATGTTVLAGSAQGYWKLSGSGFQRYNLETNSAIGTTYPLPFSTNIANGTNIPFACASGKYIYYGGLISSSNAAQNWFYRFDTESGTSFALAPLPRAFAAGHSTCTVLIDGRLLICATSISGVSQTQAANYFYIYDPATNAVPVEVIISTPITNFRSGAHVMALLPSGKVQIMDGASPTAGNRLSCNLAISGNNITVSAAEDTLTLSNGALVSTATGSHNVNLSSYGILNTYTENIGWGNKSLSFTFDNLSGQTLGGNANISKLPNNSGFVAYAVFGGQMGVFAFYTGIYNNGAPIVYARKP
jgi:hypothetical protein